MDKFRKHPWLALAAGLAVALVSLAVYFKVLRKRPTPLPTLTNSLGMQFVQVPAGKFQMGSPTTEPGRGADEELHEVEISRPFYLATTEVTQGVYEKLMGTNPAVRPPDDAPDRSSYPVENVSWDEAVDFCRRLSEVPAEKAAGRTYRLPTEAEWEYACRAGTTTAFPFPAAELDAYCRYAGNSLPQKRQPDTKTRKPLQAREPKKPNRWRLYDMNGSVWEWCADWYAAYDSGPVKDPRGPATGRFRVARGGSWADEALGCRSARRLDLAPGIRLGNGLRVVLVEAAAR